MPGDEAGRSGASAGAPPPPPPLPRSSSFELPGSSFGLVEVRCWDRTKTGDSPPPPIAGSTVVVSTGIGYLDHMLDQIPSHGQVGLSLVALRAGSGPTAASRFYLTPAEVLEDGNRHSEEDQDDLLRLVGAGLGEHLRTLLPSEPRTSRFCCPLDEALVECTLTLAYTAGGSGTAEIDLAPYGNHPPGVGRTRIGTLRTSSLDGFFAELARTSGLDVRLRKMRGDNGHHVVESTFKAFSRAFRCLVDGTSEVDVERMWGVDSVSYKHGAELDRGGELVRKTKETSIEVKMRLDGGGVVEVDTGIKTLDGLMGVMAKECTGMSLTVKCQGDLWVDDHHTAEDVAIAIGQVLNKSLGSKAGLNRMWTSQAEEGAARVEVVMDLSNRPCLTSDLDLCPPGTAEEKVGDLSIEMIHHVLDSLVMNGQMTVHVVQLSANGEATASELATAAFRAFGRALGRCVAVDPRRAGGTASSKGTLSV